MRVSPRLAQQANPNADDETREVNTEFGGRGGEGYFWFHCGLVFVLLQGC